MIRLFTLATVLFLSTSAFAQTPNATPAPAKPAVPARPFTYTAHDTDITLGKQGAPVTIVEYASLSCPHCAHFFNNVMPAIASHYIDTGKVFFVYRDYPLNSPALKAAEMVQCADKDRRHAFLKVLFSTQSKWAFDPNYQDSLAGIAALGGLERSKFDACLNDKKLESSIIDSAKEAQDVFQVKSTPTFFINGKLEEGDAGFDNMSKDIDKALAKK